ncbi:hypothetical protein K227x_32650 [Rubripirellula lacrimiformis]|uniref:Uncharacterized protein n=1 Tax=Rubripirellula lacrimiformis TaxID=1930273 RepID=A0A517NCU0_9BACT|nr:hypothetical protein K227x_32650 [Rubripirellula lacrimiformis]
MLLVGSHGVCVKAGLERCTPRNRSAEVFHNACRSQKRKPHLTVTFATTEPVPEGFRTDQKHRPRPTRDSAGNLPERSPTDSVRRTPPRPDGSRHDTRAPRKRDDHPAESSWHGCQLTFTHGCVPPRQPPTTNTPRLPTAPEPTRLSSTLRITWSPRVTYHFKQLNTATHVHPIVHRLRWATVSTSNARCQCIRFKPAIANPYLGGRHQGVGCEHCVARSPPPSVGCQH